MIAETRRTFMKLLGFTSINAPRAMAELPALLSAPSTIAALTLNRGGNSGSCELAPPAAPETRNGLRWIIAHQIERMKRDVGDELYMRRAVRETRALDGDLQAMRSISLVNRQRMQRERDEQFQSLMRKAEEVLYG